MRSQLLGEPIRGSISGIVEPLHEPTPLPACGHPLPALRGEGRERGANLVHGPNACEKRKGALHEPPPHHFPLPIRWGEGGRRSGEGWFIVPMHAKNERGLSMNLVGRDSVEP